MELGPIALVNYLSNPLVGGGKEIKFKRILEELKKLGVDVEPFDMWDTQKKYKLYHVFGSDYYLSEFVEVVSSFAPVIVTTVFYSVTDPTIYRLLSLGERAPLSKRLIRSSTWGLRKRLLEKANLLLPNSEAEAKQLEVYFKVPREKMRIVPSGVDEEFSDGDPKLFAEKFGIKDFILCVARVESRKNQLKLLKALKDLKVPVVLIGPPHPMEREYTKQVEAIVDLVPHFHWIKGIPYNDPLLKSAYKAARVHVLVSLFDSPGQSSLQAGLAGTKVVVSDLPPIREYLKDFAFYANPRSKESIREAVKRALRSEPKPGLKEHILSNYTWKRVAQKTLEVYKEVLEYGT
jgi:glycosyltransferase involved in cell wall biosynthesis